MKCLKHHALQNDTEKRQNREGDDLFSQYKRTLKEKLVVQKTVYTEGRDSLLKYGFNVHATIPTSFEVW